MLLSFVLAYSTGLFVKPDEITAAQAKDIAVAFVQKAGIIDDPTIKVVEQVKMRVPVWAVIFTGNDTEYYCFVGRSSGQVTKFLAHDYFDFTEGKGRTGERAFATADLARKRLEELIGVLDLPYTLSFDSFTYKDDDVDRYGRIRSGYASGNFHARIGGYRFIDRSIAVKVLLDSQSGHLLSYSSTLDAARPVQGVKPGITREQAEVELIGRAYTVQNFLKEKGWYLPDGEITARLGWRFVKDDKSPGALIVDAQTKDVYQVRGLKSVKLPGTG